MRSIEHIITTRTSEILDAWADEAKRAAAARGLSRPELMNVMPKLLPLLARAGDEATRRAEQAELIQLHLSSRLRAGFDLEEALDEFAILSRAVVRIWAAAPLEERGDVEGLDRLLSVLHAALPAVTQAFQEYLREDEQAEKRYLRLLYEPFLDLGDGKPPLCPERLRLALGIVMEATGADTAALLLHDTRAGDLVMSASVGAVEEPFTRYARKIGESSFVGTVAARDQPTAMRDVETTTLDVPEDLRHSGIHAVLGVRLPAQWTLLGVLYVGMRETRAFSARELRRIEAIAQGLSFHLDNARLYAELLDKLDTLRIERGLRSQFFAVLTHDLRGPLSAARTAAALLDMQPDAEASEIHRRLGVVLRNLDRMDRMVTDLLDVERIYAAGRRLPLVLEEHELGAIAREVVDELLAEHPGRIVLCAEEETRGLWDAAALRRAIWNLVSNALKYGAKDAPVTVAVAKRPDGAKVSVHNEGVPIPADAQATLFEPFTRAAGPRERGWGLGLTLVRGAAEAHGGSVHVDSAPAHGTTFTLRLPADARPAQGSAHTEVDR